MEIVFETEVPPETHAVKRQWADTETPTPPRNPGQGNALSPIDFVSFESGSSVHSIVWDRAAETTFPAGDDQENATPQALGTHLSSRLREVLPFVASSGVPPDTLLAEIVERLLRNDVLITPQHARGPASTQVKLSADEWMAQVRAWASSFPQSDHIVDDSRESIYGDRGS